MRKVPVAAAQIFAEGEFNRFCIRAVCRQAMNLKAADHGTGRVTAYSPRFSGNPRSESVAIEGQEFDANSVLLDLRENASVDGVKTALGMPAGPELRDECAYLTRMYAKQQVCLERLS